MVLKNLGMRETKKYLQTNHLDIFDLLEWNASQIKKCNKKTQKAVHKEYKALLERFKEHHLRAHYESLFSEPGETSQPEKTLKEKGAELIRTAHSSAMAIIDKTNKALTFCKEKIKKKLEERKKEKILRQLVHKQVKKILEQEGMDLQSLEKIAAMQEEESQDLTEDQEEQKEDAALF